MQTDDRTAVRTIWCRLTLVTGTTLCFVAVWKAADSWTLWAVIGVYLMAYAAWVRAGLPR